MQARDSSHEANDEAEDGVRGPDEDFWIQVLGVWAEKGGDGAERILDRGGKFGRDSGVMKSEKRSGRGGGKEIKG